MTDHYKRTMEDVAKLLDVAVNRQYNCHPAIYAHAEEALEKAQEAIKRIHLDEHSKMMYEALVDIAATGEVLRRAEYARTQWAYCVKRAESVLAKIEQTNPEVGE